MTTYTNQVTYSFFYTFPFMLFFSCMVENVKNCRENETFTSVRLRNCTDDSTRGETHSSSRRCGGETTAQAGAERRQDQ